MQRYALIAAAVIACGAAALAEGLYEISAQVPQELPRIARVRAVTQGPKHHFFGYYAMCPWNPAGTRLLCMESEFGDRDVKPGETAGVCVVDPATGALERVAETQAWNFQQGALAQWVNDAEIVYNNVVDGALRAVVLNVDTGAERVLPRAITAVAPDGTKAACISFGRLNITRPGYGYPAVTDPYADDPHPKEDGLVIMDLDTGACEVAASIDAVWRAAPPPKELADKTMWFNLVLWSRDSQRVAFLSRYYTESGHWRTALFTVKADGGELRCVIPYAWGCSHFDWADGERIVCTSRLHGKVGGHILFANGKDDYRLLAPDVLVRDGHCHVSWDGRWMTTDSYPVGFARMQHLYVMDMQTEAIALAGRFHEPPTYKGHWRCDLHPRWSRDSRRICIDSTHAGTRQVYVCDLALPSDNGPGEEERWAEARANGAAARDAFARCRRVSHAWYAHRGAGNWLIPDNLNTRVWRPENAGADNWSFWVLAAYLTDREAFDGVIRQTLRDEIRLTTRVGCLPDAYDIDANRFERDAADINRILFGASEYVKDGLLPMAELMGRTVWFERARGLLDDIFAYALVETRHGRLPSTSAEVNGEMLQNLCRFYFATGDERYKQWAERIGDAYFLDMLPKNNGLPCHDWDFDAGAPRHDVLSLSDHGNEIVFGLSELVALEHACDPGREAAYLPAMRTMIDTLLEIAVNEHGLWVHSLRPSDLTVTKHSTPDTWGYALDAVYTLFLITGDTKYRDAVARALRGINADPKYRDWGGADAFADAIESGLVLLNRIPAPEGFAWLEATVPAFLAKQRDDGMVEGWHGDGNYVRTALMYALMKTCGARITPWREDVAFGAVSDGPVLRVSLEAKEAWEGRLHFDCPRHRMHLGLPMNYPRLNEFPEWHVLEPAQLYAVSVNGEARPPMLGQTLIDGLPATCRGGETLRIAVRPVPGPPYGARVLRIEAPGAYACNGAFSIPVTVHNHTGQVQHVRLAASHGTIAPQEGAVPVDGALKAVAAGAAEKSGEVVVEATSSEGGCTSARIAVIYDKNLVAYEAFDGEVYQSTPYRWTGWGPIRVKLRARKGKPHTLHLLWGAKGDTRAARLHVNGHVRDLAHGGYDGFEWLETALPAAWIDKNELELEIEQCPDQGKGAFISVMKLTTP